MTLFSPPRVRVTAALIVRDEAAHLGECLATVANVVDEIVVVDTGSVDDTVRIAVDAGARVLHHTWTGSFEAARNTGLDDARGEWILYIDADERLELPRSREEFAALLDWADGNGVAAFQVHFTLIVGQTHGYEWRLWKHHPLIRFEGIIHESIAPAIHRHLEENGLFHQHTDNVQLVHLGYEGNQTRKDQRNLPLLRAEAERNPTRPYIWNHLGRVLERLGRPEEARAAWNRGMDAARQLDPSRRTPIDSITHSDVVIRAVESGRDESALIEEGLALFPENWVIRWASGLDALNRGDYETAAIVAQQIIDAKPEDIHHAGLTYPNRLFADWPYHLLGMCRFEQGRDAEAADAFERARALAPDITEYAVKARLARARAHQSV